MFNVPNGRFVDLPGYGFAKVPKDVSQAWGRLIGDYLQGRANLRAVVQIMDIRHPLTDFDVQMLEWAAHRGLRCLVLLTKADKLRFGAAKTALRSEEHTSELQSLMRISYAVFCLKKKNNTITRT